MDLQALIQDSHQKALQQKQKGEDYQRAFLSSLLPGAIALYKVNVNERESLRFEKQLWATVDLWRSGKRQLNTEQFLKLAERYTDHFMKDKQQVGRVNLS